ncbi:flagellar biosynthesis anti-sigma factor FlgM [Pigmentibacter ruber]|uniref:flagellar biosynthesis anti-sigma factor FlgM n=1 Tax=Pigmentibacter ruber TaxID=2683196 RepID=UPI00131EB65D|nr:flagellar biosynthesis anti-sigma factor FlgM [Pigmentibacter ruber]
MAVNGVKNSANLANAIQSADAGKVEKPEKANIKNAAANYAKAATPPGIKEAANVQISQKAKEMSLAKKIAEESPDIRDDKVAYFKDLIDKGEYKVDSEKVANAMVREAMRDELAKDPGVVFR